MTPPRLVSAPRVGAVVVMEASARRRYAVTLVMILALGGALRLWNLARDVPTLNSDEAIVGLMAMRLLHGEWTTFYWAQDYMGSLEAVLAAPLIRALGPTALALRLPPLLASLGFIAVVAELSLRLYSRSVGLVSGLLLALGAPFFTVVSVRALGGYSETVLIGASLLLLALLGARPAGRRWPWVALAGGLAGLGLWTNPLITPYLLAAGLIWWMQRRRDLTRWPNGPVLAVGVVVGALPAVIYNTLKPAATIAEMVGMSSLGAGPRLTAATLLQRGATVATVSLPVVSGAPFAGFQVTGFTPADFLLLAALHPLEYAVSLAALALSAVALGQSAARLIRWRTAFAARGARRQSAYAARRQGQAALLLLGGCYLAGFMLVRDPVVIASPRYLLPLYTLTPLIVGEGWLWLRRAHDVRLSRRAQAILATLVIGLVLAWNITGTLALTPGMTAAIEDGQRVSGQDRALLMLLTARHIHTVITSGYWIGYKLCYESGETIIPVMRAPDGVPGYNRYQPYLTRGLADLAPAYLELVATPQEGQLRAQLARSGALPGYTVMTLGGYVVALPPTTPARSP